MQINLNELAYKDKIEVSKEVVLPKNYFENSNIKGTDNLFIDGYFYENDVNEYIFKGKITGIMYLLDSITNEKVDKEINIEINDTLEEFMQNNENILDLQEFLWQNIVLEEPISYTKSNIKDLKGDNWQFSDKEDDKIDPRMEKLYEIYKGGE